MAQDIVGSKMTDFASDALKPRKAGYGQNGFGGASSDLPNEKTSSDFLPAPGKPVNDQTRMLQNSGKEKVVPDSFGMESARKRQPNTKAEGV